ncbi:DNA recombination protein RmuC [Arcobacter sp.]|uniref:DNA recombination protein RmuC n=1 Tax=Arcobacter sp. TaxID=1872629 RepID=UPI003D130E41
MVLSPMSIGLIFTIVALVLLIISLLINKNNNKPDKEEFTKIISEKIEESNRSNESSFRETLIELSRSDAMKNTALMKEIIELFQKNNKEQTENFNAQLKELSEKTSSTQESMSENFNKKMQEQFENSYKNIEDFSKKFTLLEQSSCLMDKLSGSIDGLKNTLSDRKARGSFGEVQLEKIIGDVFSNFHYNMQYKLSNGSRVDCAIKMPNNLVLGIDSKFPLETYRKTIEENEPKEVEKLYKQFKIDIKKHIDTISSKYIINGETSEFAVMFLPSESIFLEIYDKHFDLITYSQNKKVLIVSPSTIMSVLLISHGLLKNEIVQKEVKNIQDLVSTLLKDYDRMDERFEQLKARANQLVNELNLVEISYGKIRTKAEKIKGLELDN